MNITPAGLASAFPAGLAGSAGSVKKTKGQGEMRLEGKIALITGGSKGIGKAIAKVYAREGAKIFICARDESELEKTAAEIRSSKGEVSYAAVDLGNPGDIERLVQRVQETYGTVHVLVNNASVLGPRVPILQYSLAAWEEVLRVNITAVFLLSRDIAKIMLGNKQGSIINVSSGVGRTGKARWGAYAVSKFGVEGFTQVLADELNEDGIRVNAVNPAGTRTAMRAAAYPEEDPLSLPTPDEITGVFVYLASDESRDVTGKSFNARDWLEKSR
jgi:NAD(P)-dependent dehydrogenase (short-subunit alcohol dehydrogenase family)